MAVEVLAQVYTSRAELERKFGNLGIVSHVDDLADQGNFALNGKFSGWTTDDPDNWTVTGESAPNREVSEVGKAEGNGGSLTGSANIFTDDGTAISVGQTLGEALVSGNYYTFALDVTKVVDGVLEIEAAFDVGLLTGDVSPLEISQTVSKTGIKRISFRASQAGALTVKFSNKFTSNITDITIDDVTFLEEDNQMWVELIEEATDFVNQYAIWRYDAEDMVNSRWVRSRATDILAYLLSQRRANPALATYETRFRDIEAELQRVEKGMLKIPRLPISGDLTPAMSNIKIDDRFRTKKARVQQSTSVGGGHPNQDQAIEIPTDQF